MGAVQYLTSFSSTAHRKCVVQESSLPEVKTYLFTIARLSENPNGGKGGVQEWGKEALLVYTTKVTPRHIMYRYPSRTL